MSLQGFLNIFVATMSCCSVVVLLILGRGLVGGPVVFSHVMLSTEEGDRFNIYLSNEKKHGCLGYIGGLYYPVI